MRPPVCCRQSISVYKKKKGMENSSELFPTVSSGNTSDPNGMQEYEDYEDEHADLRASLNVMSMVVYSVAFLLGTTGNGLVIWITGFKMKKTVNTVWFLNLAIADFVFTAFLPLSITYTALGFHWPFGRFLCKLSSTVAFLNMFASVYILAVISLDRCVAVVRPVWAQNHRTPRLASLVSLGAWLLALLLSSPYFVFRDTAPAYHDETVVNCFNNFAFSDDYQTPAVVQLRVARHQAMVLARFLLGFVLPFAVIVSCYAVIAARLRRNRLTRSSKPFKVIAVVIVAFFLCWAPYHAFSLVEMVNHVTGQRSATLGHLTAIGIPIASSLAYLNSCLNPVLYVFMGQDFKEKVKKSILAVLENAFSEDSGQTVLGSNSRSKSKSTSEADV
ncbi:chemokine-like receptor 1 [Huso huso]|uniref:Chemokine-like receptor 1 n=1 Tax=Huso huso TaxID=61971 RepID=A0ABR0YB33_HUSHU